MDGARIIPETTGMNGWIIAAILACVTFGALLKVGKLPRRSIEAVGAALVLALAGYAVQGRPSLPASPAQPVAANRSTAAALIEMRAEMDITYSRARPYLVTSDSWARDGDYGLAAAYIKSGIKKYPDDGNLWSALGLQIMLASDGQMSPPAKFAFDRARKFGPNQPAPDYFAGMDALFNGRVKDAALLWQGVLAKTPPGAKWRPRLESQIAGLAAMQQRMSQGETGNLQQNE